MDVDNQALRKWYDDYMALDANSVSPKHSVIRAVVSDDLDAEFTEKRIHELESESRVIQGFCPACRTTLASWPYSRQPSEQMPVSGSEWFWRHAVVRSCHTLQLEASMRGGCKFCAFLIQMLKDSGALGTFRRIEARIERLGKDLMASLSVQNWGNGPPQLLWLNLPGIVCTNCNSRMAEWTKSLTLVDEDIYTGGHEALDLAKTWLSRCTEDHNTCKGDDKATMPTRLILIADGEPRLVLTSGWTTYPRYATLSHCWGGRQFIKLLRRNLDSLMSIIPIDQLSKTLKDAITVTRTLGVEFLWVDSLCIIQDDEKDWEREASTMSSVYGSSFINIAASSATDGAQGCFTKPTHFVDGFQAYVTVNGLQRVQQFRPYRQYDNHTRNTHLATRAWALQEKVLPPRTLHLGNRGAFWECKSLVASEFFPDSIHLNHERTLVYTRWYPTTWRDIVWMYSAANLTFDKDKLPGLSGIARLQHIRDGDQYLAGMWRSKLETQLCWSLSDTPCKRSSQRTPTWSWASVNSRVFYAITRFSSGHDHVQDEFAHVLEASTTPTGCDPFGEVSGGVIRLCCSAVLVGRRVETTLSNFSAAGMQAIVIQCGPAEQTFPFQNDCSDEDCSEAYLLPIFLWSSGRGLPNTENDEFVHVLRVQGIVLRKTNTAKGQFSRIGSFQYDQEPDPFQEVQVGVYYDPFLRMLSEYGETTAREICAEYAPNPKHPREPYIVTIV